MRAGHAQIQTDHPVASDVVHASPFLPVPSCLPVPLCHRRLLCPAPGALRPLLAAPTHVLQSGPAAQASPLPLDGCRGRSRKRQSTARGDPRRDPQSRTCGAFPEPAGLVHATRNPGRDHQLGTPYMSRRRLVLPEEASSGLTPHRAAKDASLCSRSGLSPAAMRRAAALSGLMPPRVSNLGVWLVTAVVICCSSSRISLVRVRMRRASRRRV